MLSVYTVCCRRICTYNTSGRKVILYEKIRKYKIKSFCRTLRFCENRIWKFVNYI